APLLSANRKPQPGRCTIQQPRSRPRGCRPPNRRVILPRLLVMRRVVVRRFLRVPAFQRSAPMTVIKQDDLIQSVADALQYISYYHPTDFIQAMHEAYLREESPA